MLTFRGFSEFCNRVWLLLIPIRDRTRLLRDDFFVDPKTAARFLRTEITRLRALRDRCWPEKSHHEFRVKLRALIDALEAIVAGVESEMDGDTPSAT